jgi:hypothetical protein
MKIDQDALEECSYLLNFDISGVCGRMDKVLNKKNADGSNPTRDFDSCIRVSIQVQLRPVRDRNNVRRGF